MKSNHFLSSIFNKSQTTTSSVETIATLNSTPVFFLGSIGLQNGGLTNATFMRANLFSEYLNEVPILTINFHRNFNEIVQAQYNRGSLNNNVTVYNLFRDLDPKRDLPLTPHDRLTYEDHLNEEGYVRYEDKDSKIKAFRFFKEGIYTKYKRFDEEQRIISIDYFTESWVRIKQEVFDESGNLVKTRHMDVNKNKPKLDRYFSRDGSCYLTVALNVDTGVNTKFFLHSPVPKEFKNMDSILAFWLNTKVKEYPNPALFGEKREHVAILKEVQHPDLTRYFVLHNNHFAFPHTKGASVDPSCTPLFSNLDIFEKVIILTDEQKGDIVEQFGNQEKFKVIPHIAEPVENVGTDYKKHHAVTMGRYAHQKALHEAIHAFKFVVDEIPDATYSIYGYGELKDDLQKLINELGLKKNVFLEGFTLNSIKNYQESACSILTSKYEGLPLTLTESLAAGTPIVSYRIKYGPEDIIRDGIDGFLVDAGDRKGLAKSIVKIMNDPSLRNTLSINGQDITERYSFEKYKQKWLEVFQ